jgi:hypothetical protein
VRRYTTDAVYGAPDETREDNVSEAKEDESNGDNCKAPKPNLDIFGTTDGELSENTSAHITPAATV